MCVLCKMYGTGPIQDPSMALNTAAELLKQGWDEKHINEFINRAIGFEEIEENEEVVGDWERSVRDGRGLTD